MALTRPRLGQLNTSVVSTSDPIQVIHAGSTAANVDIGFLMNRANGLISNVALYWNESGNTFVTAFTANTGTTDTNITATSYANVTTGAHTITPAVSLASTSTTTGALVVTGGVGVSGNVTASGFVGTHYGNLTGITGGNVYVTGNVLPTANISYDLGSPTQRWRSIYISANTIDIGGATIGANVTMGTLTITAPSGASFTLSGTSNQNSTGAFGYLQAGSGSDSTSVSTGALQIVGGAGITGNLYVGGNIVTTGTGYITIPVGTTAQRPVAAASGMIRYNTLLSSFEGYGSAWSSLGGVKSVDGNTYILAEASVGASDNTLWFYNNATNTAKLTTSNLTLLQTTTSTSTTTGALQVTGGAGIGGNLYVGGNLDVAGTVTFRNTVVETSTELVQGVEVVAGNLVANSGTASTNTTTGALVVQGGAGISGDVNIGTSLTVNGGAYGNVTTTQYGSLFAYAYGPNNYSILQAWSQGTQGMGINAYGTQLYSSSSITFRTGSTLKDKDYPTGGTSGVQIAANGAVIASTGIASTSTGTGALIVNGGVGVSGDAYHSGNVVVTNRSYVKFSPSGSSNWIGLRAPASLSANVTYNLPSSDGTSGQVLKTDGAGNWSFGSGTAGGSSGFFSSTISTHPSAAGDKDLATGADNVTAETPFSSGGTDAFGVSLGIVYDQMEPVGSYTTIDLGSAVSI